MTAERYEQLRMIHGLEVQADYIDMPGLPGKLGVKEFVEGEIADGDIVEVTVYARAGWLPNGTLYGGDAMRKGEVANIWKLALLAEHPLLPKMRVVPQLTNAEFERLWNEAHGAVGE